jgi:hypothetical protein
MKNIFLLLVGLLVAQPLIAAPKVFESTGRRTPLLELFTSEGCSSCPPADDYLQSLEKDGKLWKDYIPVAFHVDYWDYLGWKDTFSTAVNTERQQSYARLWKSESVFTPAFVYDGKLWRNWHQSSVPIRGGGAEAETAPKLKLVLNADTFSIQAAGLEPKACYKALIAPLLKHSANKIAAGENRGRILKHSFAALDLISLPLHFDGLSGSASGKISMKKATAIVGWIEKCSSPGAIQATGGDI